MGAEHGFFFFFLIPVQHVDSLNHICRAPWTFMKPFLFRGVKSLALATMRATAMLKTVIYLYTMQCNHVCGTDASQR